jgi:peptidoglycan/xylan/chitin deacetylase (PgdA/CDA1 family)
MTPAADPVWHDLPLDWADQLAACIARAAKARQATTAIFFRADDVAVPGRQMQHLLDIFRRSASPLALAVVPAWLSPARWQALGRMAGEARGLWCWHQHGWRHRNHEPRGKKQEFGPSRRIGDIASDLSRGRRKLEAVMGNAFYPVFTPPWNRCSEITLALLREMGYKAVSRSRDSQPPAPAGLPDLSVAVDLHTDRAPAAALGWQRLIATLEAGLRRSTCGIMIHHQRMNDAAFRFLEVLIEILHRHPRLAVVDMRNLPK